MRREQESDLKMHRPRLLHNIASLGVLHAANAALTLITIPYLTRAFGVEGWGQIVFVQMVINYLIWFSNWSFYLGATKKISSSRNDLTQIQTIYNTTLYAQWVLTIGAVLVLSILVVALPTFKAQANLYLFGAGLLISNALQPLWFLNGMEMVRESASVQLVTKLLALPAIFLLIHDRSDTYIFFLANALSGVVTGLGCLYWIKFKYKVRFSSVRVAQVITELREGFGLFVSTVWANLYSSIIPMALGILSGPTQLGYYNLADRVRGAAIQLIHPVTHAMFPRMCHLFSSSPSEAWKLLRKSGLMIFSIVVPISIVIYVLAEPIILILAGPGFDSSIPILRILAITVPIITASEFLIYQWLIPTGQIKRLNKSKLYSLLIALILVFPVIRLGGPIGASWLNFAAEMFMVFVITLGIRDKKVAA